MKNLLLLLMSMVCWVLIFNNYALANKSELSFNETKYAGMGKYSEKELRSSSLSDVKNNKRFLTFGETQNCFLNFRYKSLRSNFFQNIFFSIAAEKICDIDNNNYPFVDQNLFSYGSIDVQNLNSCDNANFPIEYLALTDSLYKLDLGGPVDILKRYFKDADDAIESVPPIILDKETVKEAQQILNKLGYNAGSEDGTFDLKTSKAIIEFGNNNQIGWSSYGILNYPILQDLRDCLSEDRCFAK